MTRILTRSDVASLLTMDDCINAVEDVFRLYGERKVDAPASMATHVHGGGFHVKAAVADAYVAKINGNFPENPKRHNLPTVQGVIVVMDREKGTPLAIVDSIVITTMRTAAASAVAAKYLAREDAHTLAVVGWGIQGHAHAEAMKRVRPIERVLTIDVDNLASLDEAVSAADIIVTCTPTRVPFLDARHLREGVFIAAVGADNPEKSELAPALLAACRVVPDMLEQAAKMGDLHHAIAAGAMKREDIHGELGDVVCGRVAARTSPSEMFVFDSTGTALQDVAAASIVLRRAMETNVGVDVSF